MALQAAALLACDVAGGTLMALLRALAGLPLACVPVSVEEGPALLALAALLCLVLLWWPRVSRWAVAGAVAALTCAALLWVGRWRLLAPARVVVLDVGQGDAILVTDGAAAVLVDTGPGDAVVRALARASVFHLDAVVLTHLHADHAGGLEDVLSAVPVGRVVVPEDTDVSALPDGCSVEEVGYGDALGVGRFSLTAVSPVEPAGGEGNEGSLELLLSFDDGGRALTGPSTWLLPAASGAARALGIPRGITRAHAMRTSAGTGEGPWHSSGTRPHARPRSRINM